LKNIAYYALTRQGAELAQRLIARTGGELFAPRRMDIGQAFDSLPGLVSGTFHVYQAHVFISAAGIALRCIAPHIIHKGSDPAVLVCDQRGEHVISLLSGHLGGANALAERIAAMTGGRAVVTTATDSEGLPAPDMLARQANCAIVDMAETKAVHAALLEGRRVFLADPMNCLSAPEEYMTRVADPDQIPPGSPQMVADWRATPPSPGRLRLAPKILHAGIGCRKNTPTEAIRAALDAALAEADAEPAALAGLASATLKAQESGLLETARNLGLPLRFFDAAELVRAPSPHPSAKAQELLASAPLSVCEGAALLAAGWPGAKLALAKRIYGDVTVALALTSAPSGKLRPAPLWIIGLGPGDERAMSAQALEALAAARVIAGYSLYMDMVPARLLAGKERLATGMRKELDRCNAAIDAALAGKPTAMVCSGDAGIYGMAGLIFELMEQRGALDAMPVEVVPGIPALCAAAALLGAPLMHDFACVSLSDLLTPWDLILRRLDAALRSDFVLVLYNPRSKGRGWQLTAAINLAREIRAGDTPVGLVRQAYRDGQQTAVCRLEDFKPEQADMLSLVFVGNASTRRIGGRMVTPRGYFTAL